VEQKWKVYARGTADEWMSVEVIPPSDNFEQQLELVKIDQEGIF
jgi:hypothetical protein